MFRAAYRSSSGAPNCICSLWFIYTCGDQPLKPGQRPVTKCIHKPEAANTVCSSWWRAVCRSKHAEPSINFGIINSITRLHLVGYFYWLGWCCLRNQTLFTPRFMKHINTLCGQYTKAVMLKWWRVCSLCWKELTLAVHTPCDQFRYGQQCWLFFFCAVCHSVYKNDRKLV